MKEIMMNNNTIIPQGTALISDGQYSQGGIVGDLTIPEGVIKNRIPFQIRLSGRRKDRDELLLKYHPDQNVNAVDYIKILLQEIIRNINESYNRIKALYDNRSARYERIRQK
jgi:hypothetical protein